MGFEVNHSPSYEVLGPLAAAAGAQELAIEQEQLNAENRLRRRSIHNDNFNQMANRALEYQGMARESMDRRADRGMEMATRQADRQARFGELVYERESQKQRTMSEIAAQEHERIAKALPDLTEEQQAEVYEQYHQKWGWMGVPNPVAIETAQKETESPEIRLTNAREGVKTLPGYVPGAEYMVKLDRYGNPDFGSYTKFLEIESKKTEASQSLRKAEFESRMKMEDDLEKHVKDIYGKQETPDTKAMLSEIRAIRDRKNALIQGFYGTTATPTDPVPPQEPAPQPNVGDLRRKANAQGLPLVVDDDDYAALDPGQWYIDSETGEKAQKRN